MPNPLMTLLPEVWRPEYPLALLVATLLLALSLRALPGRMALLRSTGLLLLAFALLIAASEFSTHAQMPALAGNLGELATLVLGIVLIRLGSRLLFRVILPALRLSSPRILEDLVLLLVYIGWCLLRLRYAGVDLSGIVATSAVITGIVAFSMQETLGNILGGLALQLDKSISIGDWIKVEDVSGRVTEVHWRHTSLTTRNGEIVVLPNSLLMKGKFTIVGGAQVPQWRRWVYFAVGLHVPPQQVIAMVEKALIEAEIANVSRNPPPQCITLDYKDGCTQCAVRYWLTNPQMDDPTDSLVRLHVYAALQREGFALAHPNMDIQITSEHHVDQLQREKELELHRQTLLGVDLFALLSEPELQHLANTLTHAMFIKGDVVTRQGAVAHWLYILAKGEADVWYESTGNGGTRRLLATLSAGQVFGEMGLMTGEPRRATVTARTDAECYRIDKVSFARILEGRPELADKFATLLAERNIGLAAAQQQDGAADQLQQHDRILQSIRRFFLLDR